MFNINNAVGESKRDSFCFLFFYHDTSKLKHFYHLFTIQFTLKKCGVRIAIDDFGSGFSNFDNIVNLDIDYVKLDGSLVSKIHDHKYRILLENMVNICHDLGIKTIAEYISDESIMRLAKSIGIDYLQGYHIHKPEHWDNVSETFGSKGDKIA